MARRDIYPMWDRQTRNDINENFKELYNNVENVVENISEEAFSKVVDSAKLNWKEPVETFNDLPSSASEGDARMTRDSGVVYRYDGSAWQEIQVIDAGPVNEVDERLNQKIDDGLNSVDEQLAERPILKVFQEVPTASELSEGELGAVLIPLFPYSYDFNEASGLPWNPLNFLTTKYEATQGLMDKEKSYAEIKDDQGLIKVTKSATSGLATVENKVLLDLDFTLSKKYRIRFDVLRSVVNGTNRGNCGFSISPLDNPSTYYPFDYTLTDGMSFVFGSSYNSGNYNVNVNYRKIISSSVATNSYVATTGGLTTSSASYLYLNEGEFHHFDLTLSTDSLKLLIDGVEYLNLTEDLSVLNSNACKIVFWGMNNDTDSIEVNHFFDNVIIDEVI